MESKGAEREKKRRKKTSGGGQRDAAEAENSESPSVVDSSALTESRVFFALEHCCCSTTERDKECLCACVCVWHRGVRFLSATLCVSRTCRKAFDFVRTTALIMQRVSLPVCECMFVCARVHAPVLPLFITAATEVA